MSSKMSFFFLLWKFIFAYKKSSVKTIISIPCSPSSMSLYFSFIIQIPKSVDVYRLASCKIQKEKRNYAGEEVGVIEKDKVGVSQRGSLARNKKHQGNLEIVNIHWTCVRFCALRIPECRLSAIVCNFWPSFFARCLSPVRWQSLIEDDWSTRKRFFPPCGLCYVLLCLCNVVIVRTSARGVWHWCFPDTRLPDASRKNRFAQICLRANIWSSPG